MVRETMARGVLVLCMVAGGAQASFAGAVKVGEEREHWAATPAAYPAGAAERPVVWSETIVSPGATFLRLHLRKLHLPDGDFLTVSSPDGKDLWTYTGRGPQGTGEAWSFAVDGDTAVVELRAGPPKPGRSRYGVVIDRIAHGTTNLDAVADAPAEIVCGTNGRENAACYNASIYNLPVARLSFQKDGSSFVCTGWLARGSNANTLVTNNHCVATQAEVASVQARFNYQTTTCVGTTVGNVSTYAGGTLLRTNASLDYTLLTLQGNPQAIWAHYTATSAAPAVGREFFLLQHPGGGWKKIAVWKDAAHTQRCDVSAANQTISGATPKSQMTYDCDTDGGSSGSPLMDALTGRIVGLHRVGDVDGSTCLNAATQMKNICADAGALLTCADE